MDQGAVVALRVVLAQHLPVGVDRVVDAPAPAQAAHPETRELRAHLAQELHQAGALVREIDEQEAVPALEPHSMEPVLSLVEIAGIIHVGRRAQRPVEPVGPGVVRAEQVLEPGAGRLGHEARATMTADVVEGVDGAAGVAHYEDAFLADGPGQEVARLRDVFFASDAQPHLREDVAQLLLVDRRVVIEAAGESRGLLERQTDRGELALEIRRTQRLRREREGRATTNGILPGRPAVGCVGHVRLLLRATEIYQPRDRWRKRIETLARMLKPQSGRAPTDPCPGVRRVYSNACSRDA